MLVPEPLSNYVRDALSAGHARPDVAAALAAAGWTRTEIEAAMAAWEDGNGAGPVPRPQRSRAARDAFFYLLLFVAFGMVLGNVLVLAFGLINFYLPDPGDVFAYWQVTSMRWSMAAVIVFAPAFWLLDRVDAHAVADDPARRHGGVRRWLSSIAMLIAIVTLMGDALILVYTFLDGHLTTRFVAKSATVAGLAVLVLAYFRQEGAARRPLPVAPAVTGLAALVLILSFVVVGGPGQGRKEQRDDWRLSDLQTLSYDVRNCGTIKENILPDSLDPMDCARNPQGLTGFAAEITYHKTSEKSFELCTEVEFPPGLSGFGLKVDGNTVCQETRVN